MTTSHQLINLTTSQMVDARKELAKFFTLTKHVEDSSELKMFSAAVDEAWHQLIENADEYKAFCLETAGVVLGHSPSDGAGVVEWVATYEDLYGELPEIWFTRTDGTVENDLLREYRSGGTIVASWNCTVILPTME